MIPVHSRQKQSFGELMGQSIGTGLSKAADFATQLGMEKFKRKQKQKIMNEIENTKQSINPAAPPNVNKIDEINPKSDSPSFSEQINEDPLLKAKKYAAAGEKDLARIATKEAEMKNKNVIRSEEKLEEMEEKLENLEASRMRYSKLKNLFSPENETKFPPAIMTALFTKDGELNPKAYALLSTEAQESVKLVSDEIKGAKDTFGARVTNFDLESYMKTLPTLLNTAEGKRVVLRDINLMNKLNIMRNEGVLDIIDKRGAGNISISKAKRMWKKDNAKKIADIKKEYINPGSVPINELDEISALLHPDVTVEDEETGQRFKSIDDQWEML